MTLANSRLTNIVLTLLWLATGITVAAVLVCYPGTRGLFGAYYGNMEWKGDPAFTAIDCEISPDTLQEHQPQLPDAYSVEWTGSIQIPKTGIYTFLTASDDGSWLFIDNILVVDNGGPHGLQEQEGKIHLRRGLHTIKIRYFQIGGYAVLRLFWRPDQAPKTLLPMQVLFPSGTTTSTRFWLYQAGRKMLTSLVAIWGILLLLLSISTHRILRSDRNRRYAWHPSFSLLSFFMLLPHLFRRSLVQPVMFVKQQFKKPQTWWWMLIILYVSVIFVTLSYARTISTRVIDRYGADIFATVTAGTLVVAGIGILGYFISLRDRLVLRLFLFAGIAWLYGYILNPEFRDALHDLHPLLDNLDDYLRSLDLFPKTPAEKIHFLEYGLLGLLLCKALSYHIRDKTVYLLALVLVYIIGLTDEGIQWALPERVGEYRDIWLNIVSGTPAIMMVWLVIRPPVFRKYLQWSSLRPLCYTLVVALMLTGLFLQSVHGFGSTIVMPDSRVQFVSAFPKQYLLTLDTLQHQRLSGRLAEEIPLLQRRVFSYEARGHEAFRDWYFQEGQIFESFCEQEILKTYFQAYLFQHGIDLIQYNPALLSVSPASQSSVVYNSSAWKLAITWFSARMMWTVALISSSLLALLAALFDS